MVEKLQTFHTDLKALLRTLKKESNPRVAKKHLREEAERLGKGWFSDIEPELRRRSLFSDELLAKYAGGCQRLIKLSSPNHSVTNYKNTIETLVKPMQDDLILPIQTSLNTGAAPTVFQSFVTSLKDPEESDYFQESIDCAKRGFLRAAAVMAWCAAINRIHLKIQAIGFSSFNDASVQMANQQKGRFKRFDQKQIVTSLSELREVSDRTALWIIEGMGLIDSNQHTRLSGCYEMRCHCAHPGQAPITEYNLMSIFSDIQQIVLENPKFEL